ncbi:MAG: hypothetical protein AAF490_03805 [Chloroflexota bacterium]
MEILLAIHQGVGNMVWMFFLALGAWGLFRAIRGEGVDGNYIGAAYIGQGLFILQGILVAVLWFNGFNESLARPAIYALYIIFDLIFLPFIYFTVLQGDSSNRGQWVLAFATLFLFGMSLRLIAIGNEVPIA